MNESPKGTSFDWYGKSPNNVEVAFHVDVADIAHVPQMVEALKLADAELTKAGFKRSDRLEPRAFGGGGSGRPGVPRPEEKPPDDLVIPEHCGVPMVYRAPKDATADRKAVSARWECRQGRDCDRAEERGGNKYGATDWHLTKKPGDSAKPSPKPKATPDVPPTNGGDRPMTMQEWGDFWRKARELGFDRQQVFLVAARIDTPEATTPMGETAFGALGKIAIHHIFTVLKASAALDAGQT